MIRNQTQNRAFFYAKRLVISLCILAFPFSLELLAMGLINNFTHYDFLDPIFAAAFMLGLLTFMFVIFRSITKATVLSGERLGERGFVGHQLGLDQVLLHVPLVNRYPQKVKVGRHSALVQTQSIYTTAIDRSALFLPKDNPPKASAKRNSRFNLVPYAGDLSSAFNGDWKHEKSRRVEIYLCNITNDSPGEKNLANDFPEEAKKLVPYIDALRDFSHGKKAHDIPNDVLELLKSLGYVHK